MPGKDNRELSEGIKQKAGELGFNICGIARVRGLVENVVRLRDWIEAGMNDKMAYLARDLDKRIDPGKGLSRGKITGCHRFELLFGCSSEGY
ncbi:MAG: hypothetical protein IPI69_01690 [Bacteroidales bacterium]|nr:hypothetical protein [Bacteroidales bacterium]